MLPSLDPSGRRQPTKVAGLIYIFLGILGLFMAGFVMIISSRFGDNQQFWLVFGSVIALYGLFRIFTGLSTLKKATAIQEVSDNADEVSTITNTKSH